MPRDMDEKVTARRSGEKQFKPIRGLIGHAFFPVLPAGMADQPVPGEYVDGPASGQVGHAVGQDQISACLHGAFQRPACLPPVAQTLHDARQQAELRGRGVAGVRDDDLNIRRAGCDDRHLQLVRGHLPRLRQHLVIGRVVAVGVEHGVPAFIKRLGVHAQLADPPAAFFGRDGGVQDGDVRVVRRLCLRVDDASVHLVNQSHDGNVRHGHNAVAVAHGDMRQPYRLALGQSTRFQRGPGIGEQAVIFWTIGHNDLLSRGRPV